MPIPAQSIGSTAPKSGTYQFSTKRMDGVTLKIPVAAGVTSVTNRRIVSLQQDSNKNLFAVVSPIALVGYDLIGFGVLEEALQSGGLASIAPSSNTFVDGDRVTVLRDIEAAYMIDYDPSNVPVEGIAFAYMDVQGRLSSSAAGSNLALSGAVYEAVPGPQLSGQLASGTLFFQLRNPQHP